MSDNDRMDTSEEEDEEDEEEGQGINMMNFMFGNVDSHGELEGDFLDEEAKQSLGGLQSAPAGLDLSDLAENRPSGKGSAAKAAASKSSKQLADTVGESDISDEEDWLTEPAETAKPSAPTGAPPIDTAAAASFAPSSLATLGQPAFQEEDDYDADEDATAAPATHSQALPVATQAAITTAVASAASAGVHGTSVQPMLATASAASGLASLPLPTPSVPAIAAPQPAAQAAVPMTQQDRRSRASSLQQQVDQARAAGIAFPVMTTTDGRPILKYSDLMQKGRAFEADAATEESIAAATAARMRAERLNALQAQTASARTSSASAAAAAVTKPAEDSDEEGFLHAPALTSLPDHLRRSDSQDSDSDVLVGAQAEEDQHGAESVHKLQQDVRKDKQADSKPLARKHRDIRQMPSGLPLCQDLDQSNFHQIPDADMDSIHVIQWERDIIWDDPDDSDDHGGELRGDSQNGAAAAHQADDWDDLDRALEMDLEPPRAVSRAWQQPSPVLEPLPKRPAAGSAVPRQHSAMHPQMLRLDQFALDDQQQSSEANPAAAAGLPLSDLQAHKARKAKLLAFSLQLKADDWLVDLGLKGAEGPLPAGTPPDLLLDLNDPGMTFEVLRGTEVEEYANAAAVILPAMPKVQPEMGHPVVYSSAGAIMARFNISKDSIYFPAGKRKGDKAGGISRLHTLQASNMSTIPLTYPQRPEMFHRPQGLWNPLVTKKLHVKNQSKLQIDEMLVKISSLVGANPDWHTGDPLSISFKKVAAVETVRALWDKAKQDKFKAAVDKDSTGNTVEEHTPLLVDRRNPFKPLDMDASLQNSVLKEPVLEFAAIFSSIKLLPTAVASAVPSQASGAALAPPAAFQRRKDLTATEGHVVLLEYFEEYPLMLSHPGMGAKLTTYYRRKSPTDSDHQRLSKEHGKWRVGSVEALQPQEESPFIGQLDPGKHQLAIETGMFRAPGFAYSTPATDFLLIRNATGAISLRELTGCIAVGQEVPAMRAPIPGSRDVREIEGGRLVVHVVRDLRNKQARAEKVEAKTGKYVAPKVHVKELKQLFRNISDTTIRFRLRDKCECLPVKQDDLDGWWQPKPGARLPSEAELRRMLSPDQWCVYDSSKAGQHRLYEQGISKYEALMAIPPERMQIAIEQLPEEKQAAAKHLDLALKTTPWTLTDNYVSRERENKGAQMAFAGPGDPTGKGRGFSFVKDTRKSMGSQAVLSMGASVEQQQSHHRHARPIQPYMPTPHNMTAENVLDMARTHLLVLQSMGNQAAKQKEGKLTGTAADLRRLKVPALKEKLRAAGVPEAVLQNVRRWELVDLLREVANIGEGGSEFARNQRMSAAEMMQRKTRLCQQIWHRQVAVLANIPEQQQSGDTASEDDIGEELQACLAGREEAESAAAKPAAEEERGLNEAQQAAEDEEALRAMREEGMLTDQPDSGLPKPVVPKKKLEAEPGARRMRRKITYTRPDGEVVVKESIYTQEKDQDKVTALNAIYGVEAWNFGSRTIKGRTGNRNRALDKTASQIKAEPAATAVAADIAVAAEAAAAVDLTEAVVASPVKRLPSKKAGGPKKGGVGAKATKKPGTVQICRDCNQAGHLTKKNKKCPMYSEEEPDIVAPWLPDLQLPDPPTQGTGYAQAPPLPLPPQAAPTLKLRINPSPKTTPTAPPSVRPSPHKPPLVDPMHQLSPSSRQAASQAAAGPSQQQQQQSQQPQGLENSAAAAQQEGPKQSEPEKRPQVPQKRPNDSMLQLEQQQQQQQPPGLKLKKQKREATQGEQAQLSGGRPSLKVKLGGSSLKRKESAADSTASAAAPKKIKLSVKLSAPKADRAATAHQTSIQPPAESSRAAADRPRALEPSEPEPRPQHTVAPPSRAAGSRPEGAEKPHKIAASRARPSEPSRAAPNRPGHHRLSKDGDDTKETERRPASAGAAPQTALPASPPALPTSQSGPPPQAPPPKKAVPKKKGDSGKKVLAKILGQILNGAKKADKVTKSWWEIFSVPVSKKNVADYNKFVPSEDEMWIKKINGKLGKSGYISGQQFKADVRQLKVNAEGYNLGGGLCAYPDAAFVARNIYDYCVAELQSHKQEIEQAERKIKEENAV